MNGERKAKIYEQLIKKVIAEKQKGYKTFGALTGGALGSGLGGTVGLVKTIKKHRDGEMDDLDNVDKLKEYLKSMGGHAAAGLGAGAMLGTGAGEIAKKISVNKISKPYTKYIRKTLLPKPDWHEYIGVAGKDSVRDARESVPSFNLMDETKNKINSMLDKKANEGYPKGYRRLFSGTGATVGGAGGGLAGGLIGAIKGLIAPGEEKDEQTGKMVQRDRLKAMLSDAGKGGLIGGGIGAGVGLGSGLLTGQIMRAHHKGQKINALKDFLEDNLGRKGGVSDIIKNVAAITQNIATTPIAITTNPAIRARARQLLFG